MFQYDHFSSKSCSIVSPFLPLNFNINRCNLYSGKYGIIYVCSEPLVLKLAMFVPTER